MNKRLASIKFPGLNEIYTIEISESELLAAINKVLEEKGVSADPAEIRQIVNDYLAENPPASGEDGKSAYAYAREGGYTGTEAEFGAKMAAGSLQVTLTMNEDGGTFNSDKTAKECGEAFTNGVPIYVMTEPDVDAYVGVISTAFLEGDDWVVAGNLVGATNAANTMSVLADSNGWVVYAPPVTYALQSELPKALHVVIRDNGDGTGTSDKTLEEILAAHEKGSAIICRVDTDGAAGVIQNLMSINDDYAGTSGVDVEGNYWAAIITPDGTTVGHMSFVPTTLPNPNSLTIGDQTYNGASAVNMTSAINALIDAKLGVIENGAY